MTHHGRYYTVEDARLDTRPDTQPLVVVAAGGPRAAELAGRLGGALINFTPDPQVVETFEAAGGRGKPMYVQLNLCWAADEAQARCTAFELCPSVALPGELGQHLPSPKHFGQAVGLLDEEAVAQVITCGPDPSSTSARSSGASTLGTTTSTSTRSARQARAGRARRVQRPVAPWRGLDRGLRPAGSALVTRPRACAGDASLEAPAWPRGACVWVPHLLAAARGERTPV